MIQLFSANAIDTFIQLLNKLGERLVTPWRQNQPFSSNQCFVLVNLAVPLLQLIHAMLVELIGSGKVPFKDARLLHGAFILHTILCSRPVTGQLLITISQVKAQPCYFPPSSCFLRIKQILIVNLSCPISSVSVCNDFTSFHCVELKPLLRLSRARPRTFYPLPFRLVFYYMQQWTQQYILKTDAFRKLFIPVTICYTHHQSVIALI